MSEIDQYQHRRIGLIECPTDHPSLIVLGSKISPISIPLYVLDEDARENDQAWQAKKGDVLLGGGRGECPVFRISIPEVILFFTSDWDEFEHRRDLYASFWSPNAAFALCNGFQKLGWVPVEDIESWLAERIVSYLLLRHRVEFGHLQGKRPFQVYTGPFKSAEAL